MTVAQCSRVFCKDYARNDVNYNKLLIWMGHCENVVYKMCP